jgi:hypothetical protein
LVEVKSNRWRLCTDRDDPLIVISTDIQLTDDPTRGTIIFSSTNKTDSEDFHLPLKKFAD